MTTRRIAAATALAVACGALAATAVLAAAPDIVRVGLMFRRNEMPRVLRAVEWVNERDDILPNSTLVPVPVIQAGDISAPNAMNVWMGGCNASERVDFFVTPSTQISTDLGHVAREVNLPLFTSIASSGQMSDKTLHPTSNRIFLSSEKLGRQLAKFIFAQGWRRVGVVALFGEPFTDTTAVALADECDQLGIDIPLQATVFRGAPQDRFDSLARQLRDADIRVTVVIMITIQATNMMRAAQRAGMVGPRHQWLMTNSVSAGHMRRADWYDQWPAWEGVFGMKYYINESAPGYAAMVEWQDREADEYPELALANRNDNDIFRFEAVMWGARSLTLVYEEEERCAALADDAARLADEACAFLAEHPDKDDRTVFFSRRVDYEGFGGRVNPDANGDVAGVFKVVQYVWNQDPAYNVSEPLGVAVDTMLNQSIIGFVDDENGIVIPAPIVYYGGATEAPLDGPVNVDLERTISPGLRYAVMAVAALVALASLAIIGFTTAQSDRKIIKMSSPRINNLSTFGCVAAMATLVVFGLGSDTDAKCAAQLWTLPVSLTLIFGPLFAKIWRVNGIFNATKLSRTHVAKDWELFAGVGLLLAVDVVLLGAWSLAGPLESVRVVLESNPVGDDLIEHTTARQCQGENGATFVALVVTYKAALMVAGAVLAYKTRNVTIPALNDAKWIGFAVYNWVIALLFGLPVAAMLQDSPSAAYGMTCGAMLFAVVGTLALVHGPKLIAIATGTEDTWTATGATTIATRNFVPPSKRRSLNVPRISTAPAGDKPITEMGRLDSPGSPASPVSSARGSISGRPLRSTGVGGSGVSGAASAVEPSSP